MKIAKKKEKGTTLIKPAINVDHLQTNQNGIWRLI